MSLVIVFADEECQRGPEGSKIGFDSNMLVLENATISVFDKKNRIVVADW